MKELLLLRFQLGARVKKAGAVYYRVVGRTACDDRVYWFYYETRGPDVYVKAQLLGPVTVGGQSNLFAIPYDADRHWRSGQYHAALPIARRPATVALELLDGVGHHLGRLRYHLGTVGGSGSVDVSATTDRDHGAGWGDGADWGDGVGLRVDVRESGGPDRPWGGAPREGPVPAARPSRELAPC
ncbi:MAG TPA: hypothetical protein VGJ07_20875 [Rugosimonospora sp.]